MHTLIETSPNPVWATPPSFHVSMYSFTRNSFRTRNVHMLKKLFNTPIWQEKLLRRAQVRFSHTKENAAHHCLHAHTTMLFIGTTLSHCPAEHAESYVHTNHQVLQLRQCVTYIWGHTSHVTCTGACTEVQDFQQWRIRERNSRSTAQKACQPVKHEEFALHIRQSSGKFHPKIHWCLPWCILFQAWITATICSLWVRSTGYHQLRTCFNFQLMPPVLLWYIELQTLCKHFVYSTPGCSRHTLLSKHW